MLSPQLQRLPLYPVPTPSPAQPPLHSESRAPFNLTVISHLGAVAVLRVCLFFPAKVVGSLVNVTEGFHFFYTKEKTQAPEAGAGPWELFLGPSPAPGRLRPTCCAAHQRLLLGFQKKATKGKSEPARFPSNQRSGFRPGGFRHRRAPPPSWSGLKENSLAIGPLPGTHQGSFHLGQPLTLKPGI